MKKILSWLGWISIYKTINTPKGVFTKEVAEIAREALKWGYGIKYSNGEIIVPSFADFRKGLYK